MAESMLYRLMADVLESAVTHGHDAGVKTMTIYVDVVGAARHAVGDAPRTVVATCSTDGHRVVRRIGRTTTRNDVIAATRAVVTAVGTPDRMRASVAGTSVTVTYPPRPNGERVSVDATSDGRIMFTSPDRPGVSLSTTVSGQTVHCTVGGTTFVVEGITGSALRRDPDAVWGKVFERL